VYPGHAALAKNCGRRSSAFACSSTEVPFGQYAYLCRSTDRLVTPGTERSKSGSDTPSERK
jgi:hypothetical protein